MEGFIYDTMAFESVVAFLGGIALLAIVAGVILLGYVSEKEARGERVFWAEWPIPEGETYRPAEMETIRRAA